MNNNDLLKRLRYALDIKDSDMVAIFRLGGVEITKETLKGILTSSDSPSGDSQDGCDHVMLESFLNGFITHKRGKKESASGESDKQLFLIKEDKTVNNVFLKKVKIALSLTGDDMLAVFKEGGLELSNGELSAVLRREGQRNYKVCGDRYVKAFLKGLAIRYRMK